MIRNIFPIVFIFLIIGFILQHYFGFAPSGIIYTLVLIFAIIFISYLFNFQSRFFYSVLFALFFVVAGSSILLFSRNNPTYVYNESKLSNYKCVGVIVSMELPQKDKVKFNMKILNRREWNGNLIKTIVHKKNRNLGAFYKSLNVGDTLSLKGVLLEPSGKRNPFEFDYRKFLKEKNIAALLNVYGVENIKITGHSSGSLFSIIHSLRRSLDERIHKLFSPEAAALLRGLILADRSEMDYSLRTRYVNSGVVHVLAVSGLHVGFILIIFLFLFGRTNIYVRYLLTIIGLCFFVLLTGMPTSVVRAALMAVIVLVSYLSGRKYNLLNSVLLAGLIILLFEPKQLFAPGFQLSFAAVLSIIYFSSPLGRVIKSLNIKNKYIRGTLLFLSVSIAAQIGTLPFTIYYFGKISVAALLANLVVIPLIGIILAVGIITLFASPFFYWSASVFASANELLVFILNAFINFIGSKEIAYINVYRFTLFDSLMYFIVLISVYIIWTKFKSLRSKIIIGTLIVATGYTISTFDNYSYLPNDKLTLISIDVSQGDAFFLRTAGGKSILIDCGEQTKNFDYGQRVVTPLLKNLGVDTLNYIFLSHLDNDHYGGVYSILDRFYIDTVYLPKPYSNSAKDKKLISKLGARFIPYKYYMKGKIRLPNSRMYILNDTAKVFFKNRNDNSGLLKFVYGDNEILFTGDLSKRGENIYANIYGEALESDILKVGHHGSKSSTSLRFLKYVKPEYAIISVGKYNKFGHPSKVVITRLNDAGVKILRTDYNGAVVMQSDGRKWHLIEWRKW